MSYAASAHGHGGSSASVRERGFAIAVYCLLLAGSITGAFAVAGLILAYLRKGRSPGRLWTSHYVFQIRTFWLTVLYALAGVALMMFFQPLPMLLGGAVIAGAVVLWLARGIIGLIRALEWEPIADPRSPLLGR